MRNSTVTMPTVVIIGDDEAVRDSLRMLLESYGLMVEDYASCPDALQALGSRRPDCLVIDLDLRRHGGLGTLHAFGGWLEGLPVIAMSGCFESATKVEALAAGAMAVLEKPIDSDELIRVIRFALETGARRPFPKAATGT